MTKTILLVDDTPDALLNLRDLLRLEGFEINTASNGVVAIEALRGKHPDVIVTDLHMPEMDGFDLIKKLKETEEFRSIPIIVFSAHTTREYQSKSLAIGALKFLKKPSPIETILGAINDVLERPLAYRLVDL